MLGLQKYSDDALDALEFIFKNFLAHLGTSSCDFIEEFSEVTHTQSGKQVVVERHPVPGGAVITVWLLYFLCFTKLAA